MGSLWRFPYLCIRNGGGTFLLTYCVFVALCGVPLFLLETCVGQYFGKSALVVWNIVPFFKGLGIMCTFISTCKAVYYNSLVGWCLYYTVMTFNNPLPWTTCNNTWNSPACVSEAGGTHNFTGALGAVENKTGGGVLSSEEYWQGHVLGITDGIEDIGSLNWKTSLTLTAAWCVTFFVLFKGIKTSRKVIYVTATAPFVLLLILMIRGATLPGAADGALFFITPQWTKLGTLQVWLEGFIFGLYSLGPGWGSIVTFASYNDFHNNAFADSVVMSVMDTVACFIAGFTIFTIMGHTSYITGVPIDQLPNSGPGLAFVTYPYTASLLPLPQLWSALFFLTMFFLAVDSHFGLVKVFISGISDLFPETVGRRKTFTTLVFCVVSNALALVFMTQGGMYYYLLIDWYSSSLALVVINFCQSVVIGWIYGIDRFLDHLREMMPGISPKVLSLMKYIWKYASPVFTLTVFVTTMLKLRPPTYSGYHYPDWAVALGWAFSASSLLPLPLTMVYVLLKQKGSLLQRLRRSLVPHAFQSAHQSCERCFGAETQLCASEVLEQDKK